jgi:hypothetical protein
MDKDGDHGSAPITFARKQTGQSFLIIYEREVLVRQRWFGPEVATEAAGGPVGGDLLAVGSS